MRDDDKKSVWLTRATRFPFDDIFLFLYALISPPLSNTSLRVNTLSCVVTRLCQCFDKFFKGLISLHKSEFGLFYDVLSKLWESTIRLEALI